MLIWGFKLSGKVGAQVFFLENGGSQGVHEKGGSQGGSQKGGFTGGSQKGVHVNPMNPPGYGPVHFDRDHVVRFAIPTRRTDWPVRAH